jgi:hypothetical protein
MIGDLPKVIRCAGYWELKDKWMIGYFDWRMRCSIRRRKDLYSRTFSAPPSTYAEGVEAKLPPDFLRSV